MLRRIITGTILLVPLLATLVAGCDRSPGGSAQKRIILLNNTNSPFWDACRAGLQAASKDLKFDEAGLRAVFEVNTGTPQGQLDKLRQFGTQPDIVGIAISAADANNVAVAEEMRRLRAKGVHVICVDGDVGESLQDARAFYLGTDNRTAGRVLGTATATLLDSRGVKEGSYVQFVGRTGAFNAIQRMDGVKETLGAKFREADRMGDNVDRSKAQENVRNALLNHPDVVALIGIWSYNAPAIVTVLDGNPRQREKVVVSCFDAEPIAITDMGEGKIDVMIVQDPYDMGYQSVRLLKALVQDDQKTVKQMYPQAGQPGGDIYETGLKVVAPDKGSPLTAASFQEYGNKLKFMPLAEFKKWLAKYGLSGS